MKAISSVLAVLVLALAFAATSPASGDPAQAGPRSVASGGFDRPRQVLAIAALVGFALALHTMCGRRSQDASEEGSGR